MIDQPIKSRKPLPQQLLVEGQDDQHVVRNLCEQNQVPDVFDVEQPGRSGGIDELLRDIPVRLKLPGLRTLGIVVDSDVDLLARWSALRGVLPSPFRETLPSAPPPSGWIYDAEGSVRLGIWLMPDNIATGMLEDFARQLIPENDDLLPIASTILQQIDTEGLRRYRPTYRAKALIHTWLAWQEHPGHPMGLSIKAGTLRHDAPHALAFVAWLRRLFNPTLAPEVA